MSEQRFVIDHSYLVNYDKYCILDKVQHKHLYLCEVVGLLNEQQALISALKKENKQLKAENNTPLPYVETGLKFARAEKKSSEQQATINELTKNRDRWRELAKLHNGYFNCLEKAIEKAYEEKPYPKIEDIMDIYSELEKEFDDE